MTTIGLVISDRDIFIAAAVFVVVACAIYIARAL